MMNMKSPLTLRSLAKLRVYTAGSVVGLRIDRSYIVKGRDLTAQAHRSCRLVACYAVYRGDRTYSCKVFSFSRSYRSRPREVDGRVTTWTSIIAYNLPGLADVPSIIRDASISPPPSHYATSLPEFFDPNLDLEVPWLGKLKPFLEFNSADM